MNSVSIHGKIVGKVEQRLVKSPNGETPQIKFKVMDLGLSYQKNDPLIIEVTFVKDGASSLFEYLTPNKEVYIIGFLRTKKYKGFSQIGISAEYITLLPMYYKKSKTQTEETNDDDFSTTGNIND